MEEPAGARKDPVSASVSAYTAGADEYEATHAAKLADRVERFASSLPVPSLLLDAGCGPGRDMARFAAHGHVVRGVDLNPLFVARAAAHGRAFQLDLREVGRRFPAGMFDGVWASASLVHLTHADAAAVLQNLARLLRPGGKLFVSVRSIGETGWLHEPDGRRWYSVWQPEAIAAEVTAAGLRVDDVAPGPYTEVWAGC